MKASSVNSLLGRFAGMVSVLTVAGCSLQPAYDKASFAPPSAFKDQAPLPAQESGSWKAAEPSEALERGLWWTVFNDAVLNDLEHQAMQQNQNLHVAVARLKQARALNQSAQAGLFPSLDAGFSPTRQRLSPASQSPSQSDRGNGAQQTLWRAQGGVSYEVDLFGRVASTVEAADAETQRSEALLRSVQLSVQADVAQNYFVLRQLDAEIQVFADAVRLREQALELVGRQFELGDISALDVARAESELAIARSEALSVQRRRAGAEHSLAVLLGKTPEQFSLPSKPLAVVDILIPAGLPSSLLERRPDIAAAERSMAAANARIGMAKAAFFPALNLTGAAGFESGSLGNLFQWSSRTFLLGPLVGTALNVPIFDGGLRKGNLANAKALYEQEVALYREQVLVAFQEVEDGLSDLRILRVQTEEQDRAVDASSRASSIARSQYTEGNVIYLAVIDAERTALQSRRLAVQLRGVQATATVNLIRALGGGWEDQPSLAGVPSAQ